jgi:hypothetical protein
MMRNAMRRRRGCVEDGCSRTPGGGRKGNLRKFEAKMCVVARAPTQPKHGFDVDEELPWVNYTTESLSTAGGHRPK